MKPRATNEVSSQTSFDAVCSSGGKLSALPMLFSLIAVLFVSVAGFAQKGAVPVKQTQPPTVIVINDYYPGEGHVPAEVASYAFARENGGEDAPSPVINTCPSDLTVECFLDVDHVVSELSYDIFCGPAAFVFIYQPPGILDTGSCPGTEYEIVYEVWDQCGGNTQCTQTFTIDNDGPAITFCPTGGEIESADQAVSDTDALQYEVSCPEDPLCAEITKEVSLTESYDPCLGELFIFTYTITDGCDRSTSCEQVFNILPPALDIVCEEDETVECLSDIMPSEADVEIINAIDDPSVSTDLEIGEITLVSGQDGCDGAVYAVTYTVTDDCEREASCTRNFTLENEGPTIELMNPEVTIECAADAAADLEGVITSTSCELGDSVTVEGPVLVSGENGNCAGDVWNFIYTVTDECGRSASATQVVNIDNAAPTIEAPAALVFECAEDAEANPEDAVVTTSCELGFEISVEGPELVEGDGFCDGSVWKFTYTATDDCGRESEPAEQMVTIENDGPTIELMNPEITIACAADAAPDFEGVIASSACTLSDSVTVEGPVLITGENGNCSGDVWNFTYTVTDECGRTASAVQTVNIENDGPTIVAPEDVVLTCAADAAPDTEGTAVTTSCGLGFEVTAEGPELLEGDGFCPGSVWQFTYTVTDDCGRTDSDTQLVTIENDGPSVTAPDDISIDCSDSTDPEFTGEATAFFPCGEGEITFEDLPIEDNCPQTLVRVWSASDGCSTVTAEQTITITDTTAPELFMPEVTEGEVTCQQVDADQAIAFGNGTLTPEENQAFLNVVRPLFMQNGLVPTGTQDDCNDSEWDEIGVNVITEGFDDCTTRVILECIFVAIDECGNTSDPASTFLAVVSVNDPSITAPEDVVIECAEDAAPNFADVMASADCNLAFEVDADGPELLEGDGFCSGSVWQFTYIVTDECGRTATDTQLVTIENEGPTIEAPAAVVFECAEDAVANPEDAVVTTSCGFDFEVTTEGPILVSGDGFCDGSVWKFVYTAIDDCGRESEPAEQTVTIENDGPTIALMNPEVTIECAADAAPDFEGVITTTSCGLTDSVTVEGPILVTGENGNCDGDVWNFIYTVTDACGREASAVQTVTIENDGPVITAPEDVVIECAEDAAADLDGAMVITSCELDFEVFAEGPLLVEGDGFCDGSVWKFVYTAIDACGRESEPSEQMVTIQNDGPTIAAPADAETDCVDGITPDFDGVEFTVACGLDFDITATDPELVEGTGSCNGTQYTITYTITDECERTAESVQTFTIFNEGLTVDEPALPQDTSVECYEDITSDPMAVYNAVATSCSTDVFVQVVPPTKACCDANCPGTEYTMTYTVIDACGNTFTHLQIFTIENDGPEITAPEDMMVTCFEDIAVDIDGVEASAACDLELSEVTASEIMPSSSDAEGCPGDVYTVEYSVTDECGRTSTAVQTFTIENEGPSITAPADVTLACAADAVVDSLGATVETFCGIGFTVTNSGLQLVEGENGFCDGAIWKVTFTVTDDCGGTASDDQFIYIENDGLELPMAPENLDIPCDAEIPEAAVLTAVDPCGMTVEADFTEVTTEGSCANEFLITRTWSFDDGCGMPDVLTQVINVSDEEAPVWNQECALSTTYFTSNGTACPSEAGFSLAEGDEITVNDTYTFAGEMIPNLAGCVTDNCTAADDLIIRVVSITDEGDDCERTFEITFEAEDECGNIAGGFSCEFTVIDDEAPVAPEAPADMDVTCDAGAPEGEMLTALDACAGEITVAPVDSIIEGDCVNNFTVIRTWTFSDGCGNTSEVSQTINVSDEEAPEWDFDCELTNTYFTSDMGVDCPADAGFSLEVGDEITTSDTYTFAGQTVPSLGTCVSDNCTANEDLIIRVADISSEGSTCEKVFVITFEAEDECGNVSEGFSCTFTVIDDVAPELFMPEATSADITCQQVDPTQAEMFGNGELNSAEEAAFLSTVRPLFAQNGLIPTGTADDCNDSDWDEIDVNVITEGLECPAVAILQCFFVATDACGNTSAPQITQLVINSVNGPTIEAPADTEITCASDAMPNTAGATASADCGLDFEVTAEGPNLISGDGFCDGSVWEFVYIVTDACQRTDSAVQTVTISNMGPSITSCGGDITVPTVEDIDVSTDDVVFEADCEDIEAFVTISEPEIEDLGCDGLFYTYTYMVMDDCGRTDECSRTITVADNPNCGGPSIIPCFGAEVLDFFQGPQTNGQPVAADRSDPLVVLGEPSLDNSAGNFFSLGVGGYIDIAFEGIVPDLPGNDILVVETSFSGDECGFSDDEFADIELTQDGITWVEYGTICRNEEIDIAVTGLEFVVAIRIINSAMTTTLDGYDVDGVVALQGCEPNDFDIPEGDCYATEVLVYDPVGPIAADRMDPTQALGEPERDNTINFVSLGFGGSLILGFDGFAPALPDVDDLEVVETTFGDNDCVSFEERADVYVSQQVVNDPSEIDDALFVYVGQSCTNGEFFDVHAETGFDYFTLVKIVDVTPEEAQLPGRDGYDVDGIVLIHNCDEEILPTPQPTPMMSNTTVNVMETFPNPTDGMSNVTFTTGKTLRTLLQVYDASGREIATLFNQTADAGVEYRLDFDGSNMPNGMYIYRLTTPDEVIIRKFMIAR